LAIPLEQLGRSGFAQSPEKKPESEDASPEKLPETEPQPAAPTPQPPLVVTVTPRFAKAAVAAALRAARSGGSLRRLQSLRSRSRWSALLPELRLRAARSTDQSLRLTPTQDDPYRYTEAGGTDLLFEARLSWQLSKLLFALPEVGVERLAQARSARQRQLADRVLKVLFEWQRARLKEDNVFLLPEEQSEAAIDALQAEAELFILTDGWFAEARLKKHTKRRTTKPKGPPKDRAPRREADSSAPAQGEPPSPPAPLSPAQVPEGSQPQSNVSAK
jgi:hypothetical protein